MNALNHWLNQPVHNSPGDRVFVACCVLFCFAVGFWSGFRIGGLHMLTQLESKRNKGGTL